MFGVSSSQAGRQFPGRQCSGRQCSGRQCSGRQCSGRQCSIRQSFGKLLDIFKKCSRSQAGSFQAGSSQAGSSQADSSQAGSSQAGNFLENCWDILFVNVSGRHFPDRQFPDREFLASSSQAGSSWAETFFFNNAWIILIKIVGGKSRLLSLWDLLMFLLTNAVLERPLHARGCRSAGGSISVTLSTSLVV